MKNKFSHNQILRSPQKNAGFFILKHIQKSLYFYAKFIFMNFKERINKYKKKSIGAKISDIVFVLFIAAMLTPSGRMAIGGFVNRIKAMIIAPSVNSEKNTVQLSESNYNWELKSIDGNNVNFSDYKGKVIFLNFWATWCPPCVGEMPEIQKLYNLYKNNKNIQFLIVTNETVSKAQEFIRKREYNFPVFSSVSTTPSVFKSNVIPVTFIISKEGKILVNETGATNWSGKTTVELIEKLINK